MKIIRLIITLLLTASGLYAASEQSNVCSLRLQAAKVIARQLIIGRANDDTPMKTPHGIMPLGAIPQVFKDTIPEAKRLVIKDIARALKYGEITDNVDGVVVADLIDEAKEGIAKEYYFLCLGYPICLPEWLENHFQGISVQDLLDNNREPEVKRNFLSVLQLNLTAKKIASLKGLQSIPGIKTVQLLDLDRNKLTSVKLAGLPNLVTLDLSNNHLTCVELEDLPKLQELYLSNNELKGVELRGLPKLTYLNLSNNNLTSVELVDLPNLKTLHLFNNYLTKERVQAIYAAAQERAISLNIYGQRPIEDEAAQAASSQ